MQDAPLSEALCGPSRCDGLLAATALAPVLPQLLPAEVVEIAEAVATLQPASPDTVQLLLLVASRYLLRS